MFTGAFTPQADMKKIGKRDVVLSLLEGLADENLKPDEFTVADYVQIAKEEGVEITEQRASRILKSKVSSGGLEMRKVLHRSKVTNAYRKK